MKTFIELCGQTGLNIKSAGPTYAYKRNGEIKQSSLDYFLLDRDLVAGILIDKDKVINLRFIDI